MKLVSPYHQALQAVFLREEASHSEYDQLQEDAKSDLAKITKNLATIKARKKPRDVDLLRAVAEGQTPNTRLLRDVELGIHELTTRLLGVRLDVKFPDLVERSYTTYKTDRRISTEEAYDEYYRVFKAWCESLSTQHTKYRSKAMAATTITCNVGRNTVERAVIYGEAKENPV